MCSPSSQVISFSLEELDCSPRTWQGGLRVLCSSGWTRSWCKNFPKPVFWDYNEREEFLECFPAVNSSVRSLSESLTPTEAVECFIDKWRYFPHAEGILIAGTCVCMCLCTELPWKRGEKAPWTRTCFPFKEHLCCCKTTCKKNDQIHSCTGWGSCCREQPGSADPVWRRQKATWLCCWANGLTLVKLLTRWKKKGNVCKLYRTLARLQEWVKVTKTQNRPWVLTLQNKADNFTLCVRTAVSAYCPQPQHVETAVQVLQRLIYSINHCGFFLSV